jgi:hypothetical protein
MNKIRTKYINDEVADVSRNVNDYISNASAAFAKALKCKEINSANDQIESFTACLINAPVATLPNDFTLNKGDIVCVYSNSGATVYGGGNLIRNSDSLLLSNSAAVFLIFDGERWH